MFVRKVRTASGATAVQIAERQSGRDKVLKHLGSAHTDAELSALLEVARRKIYPGQGELDLAVGWVPAGQSVITGRVQRAAVARSFRRLSGGWSSLTGGPIGA